MARSSGSQADIHDEKTLSAATNEPSDSLTRSPPHNYIFFLTGGRDPSRVIPLIGQACRAISWTSEIGRGEVLMSPPLDQEVERQHVVSAPIGREAAAVLTPLRLAERGAMPVFGAKSKTPTSKEAPPGTLDSAHGCV